MPFAGWLIALAVGLLAGGAAGLIGIGGGALLVPFLYFFLGTPQLSGSAPPGDQVAVIAHATSLLAIVPISLRGAFIYSRHSRVDWHAVWPMAASSVLFAILGARAAVSVPGSLLKATFGVFLLIISFRLLLGGPRREAARGALDRVFTTRAVIGGAAVGFLSALLGVGGGLIAIPVLLYWLHRPIEKVAGTSLAIIVFTALSGTVAYAVSGATGNIASAGTVGYVHIPSALALTLGALLALPVGPWIQRRLSPRGLSWLFAIFFLILGARLAIANLLHLLRP